MALRPLVASLLVSLPLSAVLVCAGLACAGDSTAPCRVAADCASGLCLPSGLCAAPTDADVGTDVVTLEDGQGDAATSELGDDAPLSETGPDTGLAPDGAPPADGSDASPVLCLPDRDGTIRRAEVPVAPNLQATYLIASDVSVDSRGEPGADPRWDLAQSFAGDTKVLVTTLDPHPTWYGPSFPTATYSTRLSQDTDLLGVFEAREDGLYLLGVVSPEAGLLRTELAYDPPARLMAYPLSVGTTWASTSTVTGLTNGVPTLATETYEGSVDARANLATPFSDFDVLRVVLTLDRWVGAALYFDVQHLFVTECFGTVASLRSKAYVSGPEMSSASELRRLSP